MDVEQPGGAGSAGVSEKEKKIFKFKSVTILYPALRSLLASGLIVTGLQTGYPYYNAANGRLNLIQLLPCQLTGGRIAGI
jgi:hypothetical protein